VTFARPDLLTLAPVTGLLLVMSVTSHWRRRRRLARAYGGVHTATRLTQTALGHYPALRLAALLGAALTLTLGAAGLEQDGDEEYTSEYLADVLEKVVEALRHEIAETADLTRYCPHDGQICRHECENNSCWRELDGS